jgi:hypothetical protein
MIEGIETSLGLFFLMLIGLEVGRWLARRRAASEVASTESNAADGVVFALLGLMLAFTFTSSADRFDERRKLIIEQANAIGTAWLRVDLLAQPEREPIRRCMRDWVKLYLETVSVSPEEYSSEFKARYANAQSLQDQAWHAAVAAVDRSPKPQYAALVLSPINDWIDLTSKRVEMSDRGLPPLVMPTLITLAIAGAVLAGFGMAKQQARNPLHILLFAGTIAFSLYVIIDMSHPRSGLIRIDAADNAMRQLYASMTTDSPVPATQPAN